VWQNKSQRCLPRVTQTALSWVKVQSVFDPSNFLTRVSLASCIILAVMWSPIKLIKQNWLTDHFSASGKMSHGTTSLSNIFLSQCSQGGNCKDIRVPLDGFSSRRPKMTPWLPVNLSQRGKLQSVSGSQARLPDSGENNQVPFKLSRVEAGKGHSARWRGPAAARAAV